MFSWGHLFETTCSLFESKDPTLVRFFYAVPVRLFPVHCWICFKLVLERNAKYLKTICSISQMKLYPYGRLK